MGNLIYKNWLMMNAGATVASICSSEVGKAVAIAVGSVVAVECLIAIPVIVLLTAICCRKRSVTCTSVTDRLNSGADPEPFITGVLNMIIAREVREKMRPHPL